MTGIDEARSGDAPALVAVVVNPTKFDDLAEVRQELSRLGVDHDVEVRLLETTEDDPGFGQTREAVAAGADVVCALGGDGTVRAVAEVLVGTGVPLGLLPGGTGNLLARNLEVPISGLTEAMAVVVEGRNRTIDVGWLEVEGARHAFTVMAGLGLDATIMDDAPEAVKNRVGWAAYAVAAAKHLREDGFAVSATVDGEAVEVPDVRTLVVGSCGTLTGGIELLPDAVIDDGELDLAILTPTSLTEWLGVAGRVLTGRDDGPTIERRRCREVSLHADPAQQVEVDGDVLTEAGEVRVSVQPGALVVRVPQVPQ
jgi:YegS/Rv2252/BmrU family lipid kinase